MPAQDPYEGSSGSQWSKDEDVSRPSGDLEAAARAVCLRLLDHSARTQAELAAAIARKDIPADVAERVLERFVEVGLIDDAALAHAYAQGLHHERGLAGRAIAQKLRHRGVAEADIASAVSEIDGASERDAALALAAKKLRSLRGIEPDTQVRRLVSLLARRGYSPALAYEVVRELLCDLDLDPQNVLAE